MLLCGRHFLGSKKSKKDFHTVFFLSWKSTHHQQAVWGMGGHLCGERKVCVCVCVCFFVRGGGGGVCGGGFSYI